MQPRNPRIARTLRTAGRKIQISRFGRTLRSIVARRALSYSVDGNAGRRTLRNAGVRRALSYSVDGNAGFGLDAYDESEESGVPPKLIVLSDTEDEDTEGEDNGGSTRANAGVHRVVRYSAEGNAAVPSIIILIAIQIKFIFLCIYDFNCLFVFLQVRELRYRHRKRNNEGNKKRAVARDSYLQDTKVFVRDISSHRERFEERQKKIQIDFTTRCNINADTEVPYIASNRSK